MAVCRIPEMSLRCVVCGAALFVGGCFAPMNRPWLGPNEPPALHAPVGGVLPSSDPALDDPNGARTGSALAGRLAAAKPAPDPQAMHDVMVELQAIGAVDPAAQAQLLQDLERTNPSLWPEVMQSFRSRQAYQRRAATKPSETLKSTPGIGSPNLDPAAADTASALPLTAKLVKPTASTQPWAALDVPPITKNDQVVLKEWPQPSPTSPGDASTLAPLGAGAVASGGLPASQQPGVAPPFPASPFTASTAAAGEPALLASMAPTSRGAAVQQASFTTPVAPVNQDAALTAAIAALEATLQEPVKNAADAPRHAYLRLLYLAAGRREDALRPIAGLSPTEQDYWDKQLRAMATWLDVERIPDAPRRAAEASQRLAEATARLAQLSALGVRNMAFCTEISSYGVYTRFKDNNFVPGQQVLLYAEVENFKSVETHRGYHTVLKTSYQILDAAGGAVATDEPQSMEEYCQNPRRDYFVRYRLHLPKGITSGRYRLQLTIEDALGEKTGVSNIEFTVTTP